LARSAIETCITGLYCIYGEDVPVRMRDSNARSLQRLVAYVVRDDPLLESIAEAIIATVGAPAPLPSIREMAETIATKTGESSATEHYDRLYVPLSTFYSHASGGALLRHVKRDGKVADEPSNVWAARSAVHAADAAVGILALAVADRGGAATAQFADYADSHAARTIAPLFAMAFRNAPGSVRWSGLPATCRAIASLRRYYGSGRAARDARDVRVTRTRRELTAAFAAMEARRLPEQHASILELLANGLAESANPHQPDAV
jgi:hypothetical protein